MRAWVLAALGVVLFVACTQDFDQFSVTGGTAAGPGTGGDGGTAGSGVGGMPGPGGAGGNGGTAAGVPCGEEPDPPGGSCPDECDRCEDNTCIFECDSVNECLLNNIVCPASFACRLECSANGACSAATLTCPEMFLCEVICDANGSCSNLTLNCDTGVCSIECDANNACTLTDVSCGPNQCSAECKGSSPGMPTLECSSSCMCEPCN